MLSNKHNAIQPIRECTGAETKEEIPTFGGIAINACCIALLLLHFRHPMILLFIINILLFGLVGFYDDYKKVKHRNHVGISAKLKLLLQIMFSFMVSFFCYYMLGNDIFIPVYNEYVSLPVWLYILLCTMTIVSTSNAVNLTDGMDGLVSFPLIIAFATFCFISYAIGDGNCGTTYYICFVLMGACLGFLWYNCYPAKIFMGDVGSLSLGASLGLISIYTKCQLFTIIIGGVFVVETLSVIIQVLSFKKFKKRVFLIAPIHHHFEKSGVHEAQVVVRFWIVSILFAICSIATLLIF